MMAKRLAALLGTGLVMAACGGPVDGENQNQDPGATDGPGELVASSLSRDLSPAVDSATLATLSADNRDFAFDLLRTIREEGEEENLFISPHSISLALAMTYAGASNNTKAEMKEVLRFLLDDEEFHPAFNALDLELESRNHVETDDGESFTLEIVNQTWGQHGFNFQEDYLDLIATQYGAGLRLVDFITNFEEVRLAINAWVEVQTRDRIQDLLPPDSLDSGTRFVLVNAIYFYGSWASPFAEGGTVEEAFQLLNGSTVDVPMMRNYGMVRYGETEDTAAVSMPYVGGQVSMVALMPLSAEDDFEAWEASLDRERFDEAVANLSAQDGSLYFPSFELESSLKMKELFEAMGMVEAFEERGADFEGITGVGPGIDGQSLYISEIFHKTFVKVDEEGTEAAAATAVVGATPTSAPLDPIEVRVDRPFYYAIYDHPTETILFIGRMVDPSL